jgi:hypothetical protein
MTHRSPRPPLLALAFCAAVPAAAAAQAPVAPEPAGRFLFGAGVEPALADSPQGGPGLSLHGGYEHRVGDSRWGVRLAGDWARGATRYTAVGSAFSPGGPVNRITSVQGGALYATYRLGGTRSYLRPYALAGVGYHQLSLRHEGDVVWTGPNTSHQTIYQPPARRNSVAYAGGLGLSARVGPAALFAEGRLMVLPQGGARVDRPGIASVLTPLTFGVRF